MGIVGARPLVTAEAGLGLLVLVIVLSVWMLSASASKNDNTGDRLSGRFGWQWCPEEPASAVAPPRAAPIETGKVRTVRQGALGIEWFWCRSNTRGDLVVHARVTNYGSDPIDHVLLDFSLYGEDESFLGHHTVTMHNLAGHGVSSTEDKLPTQFGAWNKWTAWFIKLASVDTS